MPKLSVRSETWPIAGSFTISRGSRTETPVVVAQLSEDGIVGRGECMANPRYDETSEKIAETLQALENEIESGLDRRALQDRLPACAARNALDCAFWDLEAKRAGKRAWELAGLDGLDPVVTAYTLSLDTPERMAEAAGRNAGRPLLKLKLTGEGDLDRVLAVRGAAPKVRIIVDANEAWEANMVKRFAGELKKLRVELIEQPLPASADEPLAEITSPVPVCADESCHTSADIPVLSTRYDLVNIKLDKTGGLTEALKLKAAAEAAGLGIMVGCMVATSLAMAPALLVAQGAAFVDLDGPLLLAEDREPGLRYDGGIIHPPDPGLWG